MHRLKHRTSESKLIAEHIANDDNQVNARNRTENNYSKSSHEPSSFSSSQDSSTRSPALDLRQLDPTATTRPRSSTTETAKGFA